MFKRYSVLLGVHFTTTLGSASGTGASSTTADGISPGGAAFLLPPDNSHKFRPRAGVCVTRQDVSHPRREELVLQKVGLQRGGFFRFQAMIEGAGAQGDDSFEAERLRKILGIVEREFLPV